LVWVAAALSGFGQTLPEWLAGGGIPKPPDFGVRDANGVFSRDSGALRRISEQLRKLESEHGYRILLMVEPVLIATSAPELAAQLQQIWLPDGNGLVVVFEAGNRSLGFGRDIGGNPDPPPAGNRVPTHETAALLLAAVDQTDRNLSPEAYAETLIGNLVKAFNDYFARCASPPPRQRSLRLGLLTIGGLTLLGLAAIGVGALTRLQSVGGGRKFRFPVVDRPERLGAPCGGGKVTVRRFNAGPPS
jgi:hypothetical protein